MAKVNFGKEQKCPLGDFMLDVHDEFHSLLDAPEAAVVKISTVTNRHPENFGLKDWPERLILVSMKIPTRLSAEIINELDATLTRILNREFGEAYSLKLDGTQNEKPN
jgi:hypothetical protein